MCALVILATQDTEIRKTVVQDQPGQKVRPLSQQTSQAWWGTSIISAMWEAYVGGL
jgi:hypothetical protein